jgi:hypothetical protein
MIIDHLDNIRIPDDQRDRHSNELQTLDNLWRGMSYINKIVEEMEHIASQSIINGSILKNMPPEVRKHFEGKDIKYISAGNDPIFNRLDIGLLYSMFQWYAISACSYVRLVGYLALQVKPSIQTSRKYADPIIPDILWFRDKIAAHPVRASNNDKDNDADRVASVLYQVGFDDGRFYVPFWQVNIKSGGTKCSTEGSPWSITATHRYLAERYRRE